MTMNMGEPLIYV